MDYNEVIADAKRAKELGDLDLELALLRKADSMQSAAPTAAQQFQPAKDPAYLAGPLRAIAQGPTFGFGDEIESAVTGKPLGQIQADMKQFSSEYPASAMIGEVSGGLLGGVAGAKALTMAPKVWAAINAADIPLWAKVVGSGATGGAAYGAGTAHTGERLAGAATGGLIGAAVPAGAIVGGAALKKAATGILKPLWRQLSSTPARDSRRVIMDAITRAGLTPDDAMKALEESGDEAMLLDLGPHLRDLAYETQSGIGPGREIINTALDARQVGQQGRVLGAAGQTLGAYADDAKTFVETIRKAKADQAGPLYDIAHQQNIRTNPEFAKLWGGIPKSALARAKALASREWHAGVLDMPGKQGERVINPARTLPSNGGGLLDDAADTFDFDSLPDVLRIDYVKRAYDDIISGQIRKGEKQLTRADVTLRNKLLDFVDTQVPEFKQARGIWAGGSQMEDAAKFGREIFNEDADELADIVSRYGDAEKQSFRYGVAQALRDKVEMAKETGDSVSRLVGSTKNKKVIRAAFGNDEEFERFVKALESEKTYSSSRQAVQGNSATDARGQRRRELAADVPDPTHAGILNWLARNLGPEDPLRNPATNRLVAQYLTGRQLPGVRPPLAMPPKQPGTGLLVVPPSRQPGRGLL